MVKFLFSVHTITEAKQSNRQGGARAVDLPWWSAATADNATDNHTIY